MKKYIQHDFFWIILITLSFTSSVFLIGEYQSNQAIVTNNAFSEKTIIHKEAVIDDEEYESKDFHIFKNITEIIDELLFY